MIIIVNCMVSRGHTPKKKANTFREPKPDANMEHEPNVIGDVDPEE